MRQRIGAGGRALLNMEHLWLTGAGWVNQDLTSAAGGNVPAQTGCGLNAYFLLGDQSTHVYYITTGLYVEQLYFNGQVWTNQDISKTFYITGRVLNGSSPVANVTMQLTGDSVASTITDANGNYGFAVAVAGTYTVAAQAAPGMVIAPVSAAFSRINAKGSANFTVTAISSVKEYIRLNEAVIAVENNH